MKKLLILAAVFVSGVAMAQTTTKNYVKSTSYQKPVQNELEINSLSNTDKIQNITYYDGLGRPEQSIALRQGGQQGTSNSQNELTYDWVAGNYSTPFFNRIGSNSENEIINGITPFGDTDLLWECRNQDNNTVVALSPDGGWNTTIFPVDKTIGYRYTVWVKRTGNLTDGAAYHGTQYVNNLDGTENTNPYFWAGDLPQIDTWYLLVGIIHPHNYTGADTGESGVYDLQGNKVLDGSEFKWKANTTVSRFRNYLYYAENTDVKQYFYKPLLQKNAGGQKDIVTPVVYDEYGRQTKEYLSYPDVSQGTFIPTPTAISNQELYYTQNYQEDLSTNTPNPYSEKAFEASPLNRILKQGAPGEDWKINPTSDTDHSIKFNYQTNASNEVVFYQVTFPTGNTNAPQLKYNGFYHTNELYKTITKDENWTSGNNHTTEEYKNKQGQVVLKRTYNNNQQHNTYYVYDDYGNLTYVLSPNGSDTVLNQNNEVQNSVVDNLCYQYRYDHRNRLIEKKIPAKGWEYIIYDKLDRPILTQDAKLRATNNWLFTKYDALDRVTYTGMYKAKDKNGVILDRAAIITTINGQSNLNENRVTNLTNISDASLYYSNKVFPQIHTEVYTINYYDDYPKDIHTIFPNIGAFELAEQNVEISSNTKSLATGSKIRVLNTRNWIINATYYDDKARPVYIASKNEYLNAIDKVISALDFVGKPIATKTTHIKNGLTIVTDDKFTYDQANRLLTQTQSINNSTPELIVNNQYDDLGQLIKKKVGGAVAALPETSTGLQSVDYKYNIRGWLKQINDVDQMGDDLFSFKLNYNTQEGGILYDNLYNGNISQSIWRTANIDTEKRGYFYQYDDLSRISRGIMRKGGNLDVYTRHHLRRVTYDKNGNILNLQRDNATTIIDNLTYAYNGNQLQSVTDVYGANYATEGFVDKNTTGNDYSYDVNGNMIVDKNKDITAIQYNHLNLPTQVTIQDKGEIKYVYDATGVKQTKLINQENTITQTEYAGNYIYENNTLKFFSHPEGYIEPTVTSGKGGLFLSAANYVYQFKDHLGNIRLSYSDSDGNGDIDAATEIIEENNYYPFGLKHKGYNNVINGTDHKYTYNGKEEQHELGLNWIDYGARNYDASLGRWVNIDELAEDYFNNSPYNYVANTPLIAYDPDGKRISIVGDKEYRSQVLMRLLLGALNSDTFAKELSSAFKSENTLFIFDPSRDGDHLVVQGAGKNDESFGFDLSKENDNLDASNGRNGNELEANATTYIGHELSHFNSKQEGKLLTSDERYSQFNADEVNAVETENKIRQEIGLSQRTHYGGVNVYGMGLSESNKHPGSYILTRKKNYALIAKENINNRSNRLKNMNISSRGILLFYRGGTKRRKDFIKKPLPQKELHISPRK